MNCTYRIWKIIRLYEYHFEMQICFATCHFSPLCNIWNFTKELLCTSEWTSFHYSTSTISSLSRNTNYLFAGKLLTFRTFQCRKASLNNWPNFTYVPVCMTACIDVVLEKVRPKLRKIIFQSYNLKCTRIFNYTLFTSICLSMYLLTYVSISYRIIVVSSVVRLTSILFSNASLGSFHVHICKSANTLSSCFVE